MIAEHGVDKFYIELIEEYPCNTKQELLAREGYYIRERGTINKRIAGRSYKQYYEEHKEHYVEANKKRYENDKDAIQAHHKEYAERNKEHIPQKKKEYYARNQDNIKEYKKQWAENQKERLQAKRAEYWKTEIECECGIKMKRSRKWHHLRSKKHEELMKQKDKPQE